MSRTRPAPLPPNPPRLRFATGLLLASLLAPAAWANSGGITTKSFKDPSLGCANSGCHNGGTRPMVTFSGITRAVPGGTLELAITVMNASTQNYAGFNVSTSGGTLSSGIDAYVQAKTNTVSGQVEVTHTTEQVAPATFHFRLKTPATPTDVVLTAWGNAVDGSGNPSGDNCSKFTVTIASCPDADADGTYDSECPGGTDCDDTQATVRPGIPETCNGADDNCDLAIDEGITQTYYADTDGDGYGDPATGVSTCAPSSSQVMIPDDCDDTQADVYPGAPEALAQCDDGVDQDCNGVDLSCSTLDGDADGQTGVEGDCDDTDPSIYLGAAETPYDGIDQDCSGADLTDVDGDGFAGGTDTDCRDTDASSYPGAPELPDELDNDCDGSVDEGTTLSDDDGDGYSESQGDCDDADSQLNPSALEQCEDDIDQNCDSEDLLCPVETPAPATPTLEPSPTPICFDDCDGDGPCSCTTTAPSSPRPLLPPGSALLLLAGLLTLQRLRYQEGGK